jgi:signal peptidase I
MNNKKLVGKIVDYTLNVLIILFAIFLLVSLYNFFQVKILGNKYSNFFGFSLFEVQTGSMHGTIEAGDWIVVKSDRDIQVGDIVTYKHGNDFITHRVIESYKGTYVTKGDANNAKDDPIDQSQIVGKVVNTFHGFGILRKTIFNPVVILLLIITLYLFNLTFKTGKTKFDLYVERFILIIKRKIFKSKFNKIRSERVKVTIDSPISSSDVKSESYSSRFLDEKSVNIIGVKDDSLDSSVVCKKSDTIEKSILGDDVSSDTSDELSKTSMFRMISIQPDDDLKLYEEKNEIHDEEILDPDDLSKTAMFRVIHADSSDVDKKDNKIIEEEKDKFTEVVGLSLNAEEVDEVVDDKKITFEYIDEKIKSKKARNILDKAFVIKNIIYDEILNVLLKNEKVYVVKSSMRKEFIKQYMDLKYFCLDEERKNVFNNFKVFKDDLISKFVRDEKMVNIINAYYKCFLFILNIEDKKKCDIAKELESLFKFDDLDSVVSDIKNIINYSNDVLTKILDKLDTDAFEIKYNKIIGQKNLYGVVLNHNISFNKIYSDYIVDKTYNEGIISEDKIAVLLNLLLCRIVTDLMNLNYDAKYIIYIPNALYGKDKKLDKIISTIDNDYAKSHVFFLTSVSNMLSNKDDIKRLRKKGYCFALAFNKYVNLKDDDMGYIYMADYYFMDSYLDADKVCASIPSLVIKQIIKDNISKKIGDYGGE